MLNYIKYNDEKFAVTGEKDLHHCEINKIGGRWNPRMKGGAGWLVPVNKESELKKLIRKIKKEHKSRTETSEPKEEKILEKILEMVDYEIESENYSTNINEQKLDTEEVEKQNTNNSNEDYMVSVPELTIESYTDANTTTDVDVTEEQVDDEKVDILEHQSDNTQLEQQIIDNVEHDKPEDQVEEEEHDKPEDQVEEEEHDKPEDQVEEEQHDEERRSIESDEERRSIESDEERRSIESDEERRSIESDEERRSIESDEERRSIESDEEDSKTLGSMLKEEQEVIPSSCEEAENKHQELFDNYKSEMTYSSVSDDETRSEYNCISSPESYSKSGNDSLSHKSQLSVESDSDDNTIINNMKDAKQAIEFVDIDSDDDSAVVENFLNNLLGDLSDEEERTRKLKKSKERFRRITKSRELTRKKKQEKEEKIKFKQKVLEADRSRKDVLNTVPTFEFYKNLAFRNASGEAAVSDSSDSDYSDESDDDYPSASTVKKKTKAEEIIDLEAELTQLRLENEKLSTQIKTFIQKY